MPSTLKAHQLHHSATGDLWTFLLLEDETVDLLHQSTNFPDGLLGKRNLPLGKAFEQYEILLDSWYTPTGPSGEWDGSLPKATIPPSRLAAPGSRSATQRAVRVEQHHANQRRAEAYRAAGKPICRHCAGVGGNLRWPGYACYECKGTGLKE